MEFKPEARGRPWRALGPEPGCLPASPQLLLQVAGRVLGGQRLGEVGLLGQVEVALTLSSSLTPACLGPAVTMCDVG